MCNRFKLRFFPCSGSVGELYVWLRGLFVHFFFFAFVLNECWHHILYASLEFKNNKIQYSEKLHKNEIISKWFGNRFFLYFLSKCLCCAKCQQSSISLSRSKKTPKTDTKQLALFADFIRFYISWIKFRFWFSRQLFAQHLKKKRKKMTLNLSQQHW